MSRFPKPPTPAELETSKAARAARQRVLLVGCGKTKADTSEGPVAAKDLYTGNLFRARRAYAESTGLPWYILSARHGLVAPHRELYAYDTTIEQLSPMGKGHFAMETFAALFTALGGPKWESVVIELHAGQKYLAALRYNHKPGEPPEVETPLEGLGIGKQLAWYMDHTPTHQRHPEPTPYFSEHHLGGVLGADSMVYSDADPGL